MGKIKKWFSDYWYYYKWYFIGGGAALIFLIIMLAQCSKNVDYDVYITYTGPDYIGNELTDISDSIKSTLFGETETQVSEISIRDLTYVNSKLAEEYLKNDIYYSAQQNSDNKKVLNNEVSVGDSYIYIIDRELYDSLKNTGAFSPLSDVFTEGNIPASAIDEYGIQFNKTAFCKYYNSLYNTFTDDMILCLRRDFSSSFLNFFKGSEKQKDAYELHKAVFVSIVNYTAPGTNKTESATD